MKIAHFSAENFNFISENDTDKFDFFYDILLLCANFFFIISFFRNFVDWDVRQTFSQFLSLLGGSLILIL